MHRIGRTARAGQSGDAISLCCESYVYSLPDIERYIGMRLPTLKDQDALMPSDFVRVARPPRKPRSGPPRRGGGGGGNRGGRGAGGGSGRRGGGGPRRR